MKILEAVGNSDIDLLIRSRIPHTVPLCHSECYSGHDDACAEADASCYKKCFGKLVHLMFLPFESIFPFHFIYSFS